MVQQMEKAVRKGRENTILFALILLSQSKLWEKFFQNFKEKLIFAGDVDF